MTPTEAQEPHADLFHSWKTDISVWKQGSRMHTIDYRKSDGKLHLINAKRRLVSERMHALSL